MPSKCMLFANATASNFFSRDKGDERGSCTGDEYSDHPF